MRIGVDMDNVISDTGKYLIDKIKDYDKFKDRKTIKMNSYKTVYEMFGYDLDEKARFDDIYMPVTHMEAPAIKGASEVLNKLVSDGHEIYIISYRGTFQYSTYLEVAKQWLKNNSIPYKKLITERFDKGKVCLENKIELLIDDEPVHLKQASDEKINGYLFNSLFNGYCDEYERVNSWEEIYDRIK